MSAGKENAKVRDVLQRYFHLYIDCVKKPESILDQCFSYQHDGGAARQQDADSEEDVERPRRQRGEDEGADHGYLGNKKISL